MVFGIKNKLIKFFQLHRVALSLGHLFIHFSFILPIINSEASIIYKEVCWCEKFIDCLIGDHLLNLCLFLYTRRIRKSYSKSSSKMRSLLDVNKTYTGSSQPSAGLHPEPHLMSFGAISPSLPLSSASLCNSFTLYRYPG